MNSGILFFTLLLCGLTTNAVVAGKDKCDMELIGKLMEKFASKTENDEKYSAIIDDDPKEIYSDDDDDEEDSAEDDNDSSKKYSSKNIPENSSSIESPSKNEHIHYHHHPNGRRHHKGNGYLDLTKLPDWIPDINISIGKKPKTTSKKMFLRRIAECPTLQKFGAFLDWLKEGSEE